MKRHRLIAGSPERSATQVWLTISRLIVDTLSRSAAISTSEVEASLTAAAPAGTMLVAAGHLERHPMVLVAAPVHLVINSVSGDAATTLNENLSPVPGGAAAVQWTIYMPTPEPLADTIRQIVQGIAHFTVAEPPVALESDSDERTAGLRVIDVDALSRRPADR